MIRYENLPKAYTETLTILNHINIDDYKKIPPKLIATFQKYKDPNYKFQFIKGNFDEQHLLYETQVILAILFRDYWSTPYQRDVIKSKEQKDKSKPQ